MADQMTISQALQRAGVNVYGLQVSGNAVVGTVSSEEARQKVYAAVAAVDNSANLNISVDTGFAAQEAASASTGGAGATGGASAGQSYTVQSGDSLSKIAKQFYGDASQWKRIYEANRGTISNPDLIHAGQQLTIPA